MAADLASTGVELTGISDEDRRRLETLLVEFDQGWAKDRLALWVRKLPPPSDRLRRFALAELVKIDIERRWDRGLRTRLESYLKALPELGTPETVDPELIFAEYEARSRHGGAELSDYAGWFPRQIEELELLLEARLQSAASSANVVPAGERQRPRPNELTLGGIQEAPLPEHGAMGRYEIIRRLGKGSMGSVYLARDTRLDRLVALKTPNFAPDDADIALRFRREALAAAKIEHPNLCRVYDVEELGGTLVLTMEYIEGKPMSELIKHDRPLSQRQIALFVRKLALALHEAHCRGVLHRDLKPANIMINRMRGPVIVDFGLARTASHDEALLTKSNALLGTPAYMPPERTDSAIRELSPGCDVYSLGVILYELLAGRLPFQGSVIEVLAKIATQQPTPPSAYRPDLDPRLEAICLKAMAKKVEDRYATMAQFAAALKGYLLEKEPFAEGSSAPGRDTANRPPSDPSLENQLLARLTIEDETSLIEKLQPRPAAGLRVRPPRRWLLGLGAAAAFIVMSVIVIVMYKKRTTVVVIEEPEASFIAKRPPEAHEEHNPAESPKPASEMLPKNEQAGESEISSPVSVISSPDARPDDTNSIGMRMALIPPGEFDMGVPESEMQANQDEKPRHHVRISQPFRMSVFELTQAEYSAVMGKNPSWFSAQGGGREIVAGLNTDRLPVESVSWLDAVEFCNRLSTGEHLPPYYRISGDQVTIRGGDGYRLPTEAEWEYACRAGHSTRFCFGDDPGPIEQFAWGAENCGQARWDPIQFWRSSGQDFNAYVKEAARLKCRTHTVGEKRPNDFGLFDVHGNVWEWCWDWYAPRYSPRARATDLGGPPTGTYRVFRGRCYLDDLKSLRTTYRGSDGSRDRFNYVGFRPARSVASAAGAKSRNTPQLRSPASVSPRAKSLMTNSLGMKLALIPAGEFLMGSSANDTEAYDNEKPQHRVRITRPFYMGIHEVSRGQFRQFVDNTGYRTDGEKDGKGGWGWNEETGKYEQNPKFTWRNPGFGQTDEHPIVLVSWNDAAAFLKWIGRMDRRTYRLPTEAEWEYACRAGTTTVYWSGDDPENLAKVGNVADGTAKARQPEWITIAAVDGFQHTAPVGRFRPNTFGLYDMHGNVHEWCRDGYATDYYAQSPVDDPAGPTGTPARVVRGGSWEDRPRYVRSSYRAGYAVTERFRNVGFRVACDGASDAPASNPSLR